MEQRDYFQKQLDKLGRALGKVLADLSGLKSQGKVSLGIEISNKALKNELDLDIEDLILMQTEEFVDELKTKKKFTNENLGNLADILLLLADNSHEEQEKNEKSIKLYEKCLSIYEYLGTTGTTYSFDWHSKIERIKNIL